MGPDFGAALKRMDEAEESLERIETKLDEVMSDLAPIVEFMRAMAESPVAKMMAAGA